MGFWITTMNKNCQQTTKFADGNKLSISVYEKAQVFLSTDNVNYMYDHDDAGDMTIFLLHLYSKSMKTQHMYLRCFSNRDLSIKKLISSDHCHCILYQKIILCIDLLSISII